MRTEPGPGEPLLYFRNKCLLSKELPVTVFAVSLSVLFGEGTSSELVTAEATDEVLRVPFLI